MQYRLSPDGSHGHDPGWPCRVVAWFLLVLADGTGSGHREGGRSVLPQPEVQHPSRHSQQLPFFFKQPVLFNSPFKVYPPVAFSIFTRLGVCYGSLPERFHHPQKRPWTLRCPAQSLHPSWPLATMNLPSVSADLPLLGISCSWSSWNHTPRGLLCLLLTLRLVFSRLVTLWHLLVLCSFLRQSDAPRTAGSCFVNVSVSCQALFPQLSLCDCCERSCTRSACT